MNETDNPTAEIEVTNRLQPVIITSLSAADFECDGYDISELTQNDLKRIASNMHDAYLDQQFWPDLMYFADEFGLKRL